MILRRPLRIRMATDPHPAGDPGFHGSIMARRQHRRAGTWRPARTMENVGGASTWNLCARRAALERSKPTARTNAAQRPLPWRMRKAVNGQRDTIALRRVSPDMA